MYLGDPADEGYIEDLESALREERERADKAEERLGKLARTAARHAGRTDLPDEEAVRILLAVESSCVTWMMDCSNCAQMMDKIYELDIALDVVKSAAAMALALLSGQYEDPNAEAVVKKDLEDALKMVHDVKKADEQEHKNIRVTCTSCLVEFVTSQEAFNNRSYVCPGCGWDRNDKVSQDRQRGSASSEES